MKLSRLGIGILLLSVLRVSLAQDDDVGYINIRIQSIEPDSVAQWESLRSEFSEAAREAGWTFFHVYQRQRGPLATYLMVSPASPIGEPAMAIEGAPAALGLSENWFNATLGLLESQTLVTLQTHPDFLTMTPESAPLHPSENYAHVRIRTAAAGRSADFEEWIRDDLVPGLREAGAGDVRSARVVLGGSPRTWVTFSFVPGWPEPGVALDPRIIAAGDDLIATQVDYFYTFREDLSFTAD